MGMTTLRTDWTLAIFRRYLENVECRDEILSLLEQLMAERDELQKRQEHLRSLTLLADTKVTDADNLARRIEMEARSQAKAILAQADEQARQVFEEVKARALSDAQEEIRNIRSIVEKELDTVFKEQTARLRGQVVELTECFFKQMLIQAQESKQKLDLFREDMEKNLSTFPLSASKATEETNDIEVASTKP